MGLTKALSIYQEGGLADLAQMGGYLVENVQKETLAAGLKSQNYTGSPAAGSVEYKRFANSQSRPYGTARGAGKADFVKAPPVVVSLDTHREIVEEMAQFDIDAFGVEGLLARRLDNHVNTMVAELDGAFFAAASAEGTAFVPVASDTGEVLEEMIQALETTSNEFVRGVPRDRMNLICSVAFYAEVRGMLDELPSPNVDTAAEKFGSYHGVRVYGSLWLPAGVKAVLMADEAVAQPVVSYPYSQPEKIQLSNDYAVQLFYHYGTKALAPDLVLRYEA